MNNEENVRLVGLLHRALQGQMSVGEFCSTFERVYNLETRKQYLAPTEQHAFAELFEVVVWYSPFEQERASIPNYKSEEDVLGAVAVAAKRMEKSVKPSA